MLALVAVIVISVLPTAQVFAGSQGLITSTRDLEAKWLDAKKAYKAEGIRLTYLNNYVAGVQDFIDAHTSSTHDTTDLQDAVDALSAALPDLQSLYDDAGSIIATHAGFSSTGTVLWNQFGVAKATYISLNQTERDFTAMANPLQKNVADALAAFRKKYKI